MENYICKLKGNNTDIVVSLGEKAVQQLDGSTDAIVIPFEGLKFVMTFHTKRNGWEFPGGGREPGETLKECAIREAYEEAGLSLEKVNPIGYYSISKNNKAPFKTAIYIARVAGYSIKPSWSETGEVKAFDTLPCNISFSDDIYKVVLDYLLRQRED